MTLKQALAFVARHGVVLEAARGSVPNLAEAIAVETIRGGWWGHPRGHEIYRLTSAVRDDPNVLVCRLVRGKVTFVHRRVWPALVKLADRFAPEQLAQVVEVHTPSRKHTVQAIEFPCWAPREVIREADTLSESTALAQIGTWCEGVRHGNTRTRPRHRQS